MKRMFLLLTALILFLTLPLSAGAELSEGPDPIEWIVLEAGDGRALLISRYCLEPVTYCTEWADVTWETSTLRAWMNGDFLSSAFTGEEQASILVTDVDNGSLQGSGEYDTDGGSDTQDKIFALSYAEAERYFPTNEERLGMPTGYAKSLWITIDENTGSCFWWLRSPGKSQQYAERVDINGGIYSVMVYSMNNSCARPALWVSLESGIPGFSGIAPGDIVEFGRYEQDGPLPEETDETEAWPVLVLPETVPWEASPGEFLEALELAAEEPTTWEGFEMYPASVRFAGLPARFVLMCRDGKPVCFEAGIDGTDNAHEKLGQIREELAAVYGEPNSEAYDLFIERIEALGGNVGDRSAFDASEKYFWELADGMALMIAIEYPGIGVSVLDRNLLP